MQQLWPTAARSKSVGVSRAMPQQAESVTDLDAALSAAREVLAQRQQTAERQLQRALKSVHHRSCLLPETMYMTINLCVRPSRSKLCESSRRPTS